MTQNFTLEDSLEDFTNACIEAALWSSTDNDGTPLDSGEYELSDMARDLIIANCRSFWQRVWSYVKVTDMSPEQAGHDFWLSGNGHGAGFWDGDWDHTPYADMLDKRAKCYGVDLYVGDDGMIYA